MSALPTDAPARAVTPGFGDRLAAAMDAHGPVCVGIDPHPGLLRDWGLDVSAEGVREFSMRVLEALAGRVAAVKPQSAFFERHGSGGVAVLEEIVAVCRQTSTLCIVDAKRGDIGSTMDGYADAYLAEGSPLAGDAVTLSPYLGVGSLAPALTRAVDTGRGVFVLALTSNPQGREVQHSRDEDGVAVAARVVSELAAVNAGVGAERLGPCGVVVGATIGSAARDLGVDLEGLRGPILAPGVGAQGAGPEEIRAVFGAAASHVLASTSRAVLAAGPSVEGLRRAHEETVAGMRAVLG